VSNLGNDGEGMKEEKGKGVVPASEEKRKAALEVVRVGRRHWNSKGEGVGSERGQEGFPSWIR